MSCWNESCIPIHHKELKIWKPGRHPLILEVNSILISDYLSPFWLYLTPSISSSYSVIWSSAPIIFPPHRVFFLLQKDFSCKSVNQTFSLNSHHQNNIKSVILSILAREIYCEIVCFKRGGGKARNISRNEARRFKSIIIKEVCVCGSVPIWFLCRSKFKICESVSSASNKELHTFLQAH